MQPNPDFHETGTYDENLPLPAYLSIEQYSRVFFRPDAHFVDGQIIPRQLGDLLHSHMQGELIAQISPAADAIRADCCISLRLRVSPTRIRVCDLVVLQPGAPREQAPTFPPLLCVETITEGETPEHAIPVLADYLAMGVPNLWLIDPLRRSAHTFDCHGLHHADPARLTIPDTPILVDLAEPFAALD